MRRLLPWSCSTPCAGSIASVTMLGVSVFISVPQVTVILLCRQTLPINDFKKIIPKHLPLSTQITSPDHHKTDLSAGNAAGAAVGEKNILIAHGAVAG